MNQREQQIAYFESESQRNTAMCVALADILKQDFGVGVQRADLFCGTILSRLNHSVDESLHNIRALPDEAFEEDDIVEELATIEMQIQRYREQIDTLKSQADGGDIIGQAMGHMIPMLQQSLDNCNSKRDRIARDIDIRNKRKEAPSNG